MTLRKLAKIVLQRIYLDDAARGAAKGATRLAHDSRRHFGRVDKGLINHYLSAHAVRKLQIGCGGHGIVGWLNADLAPDSPQILQLDATRPFPFPDSCFDYVFSEHMIEHVDLPGGRRMLAECHRILKPGGKLRISTPDLGFLIDLYRDDPDPLQRRYMDWFENAHLKEDPAASPALVINNFVRNWGHQFIYDETTLRGALSGAGFSRIARFELGASDDEALQGLENAARMPEGFLALETLTLQAVR